MKRIGILFQPGALWLGAHYSKHDRRWCINVLPMLTLWITLKGGRPPKCVREVPNPITVDMIRRANQTMQEQAVAASAVGKFRQRQRTMMDSEGARQWRAECEAVAREFGH